ncbi:radical SAM family heme chaperone HemW [Nitrosovibrio sp. Nv17]|jgi:oxygen-independent coproporphyrinogen-3 oxidase|uniref:radical SAM family heme chaperone HemW n=1 Tax=Nitrosovibrio sp. Nv17 TaxID=1855339 RepID=UPI000908DB23|nr:radical SAM family heme chaperone HemW [Nitrosovibrio sp. Nv17]SFW38098.1 oxygen-independent coproporphyrinogen-3 oxidase [Nitrosovibrio sp. Nv17]
MTAAALASPLSHAEPEALQSLPPLSLYIHIPWCVKKCPYCDFNSHEIRGGRDNLPEAEYVAALTRDLETALPSIWGRRVASVFFGGGTPSVFSARSIEALLAAARMLLPLEPGAEVTLEANPGTFEAKKFADFRSAGVNRLSIGIQSFDSRHLRALGRVHDGNEARRAVDIALDNFDNVNLDLMYALPHQTLEDARRDVGAAASHGVAHISAYHLTLEPNTLFYRQPPPLPDDDTAAQMQATVEQALHQHGYLNYEVSAFARPGRESRHNMNYWLFGDYLGIGAGAHSKISLADRIVRQVRFRQPRQYLARALDASPQATPIMAQHEVDGTDRGFEFMMNALRLTRGFEAKIFTARTGLQLESLVSQLDEAQRRGLITRDGEHIAPTPLGRRFLNDLLQIFLPEQQE